MDIHVVSLTFTLYVRGSCLKSRHKPSWRKGLKENRRWEVGHPHQHHFVHHKSHIDYLQTESGTKGRLTARANGTAKGHGCATNEWEPEAWKNLQSFVYNKPTVHFALCPQWRGYGYGGLEAIQKWVQHGSWRAGVNIHATQGLYQHATAAFFTLGNDLSYATWVTALASAQGGLQVTTLCLYSFRCSVETPAILTEVFRGFPQSYQAYSRKIYKLG
jgi:hypothetical protein